MVSDYHSTAWNTRHSLGHVCLVAWLPSATLSVVVPAQCISPPAGERRVLHTTYCCLQELALIAGAAHHW